jgi:hypothetical protein
MPAHSAVWPIGSCAYSSPCSKAIACLILPAFVSQQMLRLPRKHHAPLDERLGVLPSAPISLGLPAPQPAQFTAARAEAR